MKMKKVISVVLACACVFSFAACGSKSDSSKSDSAKSDKKEKLVMATNAEFPPFEYYDGDEVVGIDAEFAAAIAAFADHNSVMTIILYSIYNCLYAFVHCSISY